PCLATDPNDLWQDFLGKDDPAEYETQPSSLIECLFYTNLDSLSSFKWTDVYWIEIRFVRFDRASGETIGEDLFFLPRVETALGNLSRIRRQLLDTITWHAVRATCTSFRLSLWPRMESLPYSSLSTYSPLTALPPTLSLDPTFLCIIHRVITSDTSTCRIVREHFSTNKWEINR
ncbi:unnamed protein product, partial [Penicillium nalgiovense]